MENTTNTPQNPMPNVAIQSVLPNSTGVLVIGIISIALCWCYGIIGLTLGIIALVLSGKANKLYKENPSQYTEGSYKNMKAGRICAIIGTCLSGLYVILVIIYIAIIGAALTAMPWEMILNDLK